jgi:hypothetical protein
MTAEVVAVEGLNLPPPPPPPLPPQNRYRLDPVNKDEVKQFMHSETAGHTLGFLVITNSLSRMTQRSVLDASSSSSDTSAQADGLFDLALLGSSCLGYAAGNSRLESYISVINWNELWPQIPFAKKVSHMHFQLTHLPRLSSSGSIRKNDQCSSM